MANNNNTNGSPNDSVVITVFLLLAFMVAVHFLTPYLKSAWLYYIQAEAFLAKFAGINADAREQAQMLLDWAKSANSGDVTVSLYNDIRSGIVAFSAHNYIIAALLLFFSFKIFSKYKNYTGVPSLTSLLHTEKEIWPTLRFIEKFNPFDHFEELRGVGRYMAAPFTYCAEQGIVKNYKADSKYDRKFDEEAAHKALSLELQEKFTTYKALPSTYKVAVALVFMKEIEDGKSLKELIAWLSDLLADVQQSKDALDIILNKTFDPLMELLDSGEKPTKSHLTCINTAINSALKAHVKSLKKGSSDRRINKISTVELFQTYKNKHAYITTLIAGAYRTVKRKGKFPSGRLVFFKPWDRRLFLIINNSPYFMNDESSAHRFVSGFSSEILAIYAHYQHELFAKRKLDVPYVGTAVSGLKQKLIDQNLIGDN